MIDRPNWNGSGATLPAVVDGGADRPTFSQEDLALLNPAGDDLDATVAGSVKSGVFSREEAQAHYGYSDEEMDRALGPPRSLASVQRELAKIDRLRRQDRRAYFKDEKLQKRELELIELREKMKARPAPAETEACEQGVPDLDPELLEQWEKYGGVEHNLKQVQTAAGAVLEALEPDEAKALEQSFDALPESAKTTIYGFLAVQGGTWPAANDAVQQEFASTPEGAELVQEWGARSARNIGIVRGRMDLMLRGMGTGDRAKAEAWFDGLSPSQAKAVLKALVA